MTMLNEMIFGIGVYECPLCGRYYYGQPLEYYWCPYCGSNLQSQINKLNERITNLEEYLKELDKEEEID